MAVTSRKGRAKPRKRASREMKAKKTVKRRSAAAAALATPAFRKQVVKSAKDKNLDGAALTYVELTRTCVKCHKYVREVRQAGLDLDTPSVLAQTER